jgi:hypothetical protein
MALNMKMTVFCDVAPCSLVDTDPMLQRSLVLPSSGQDSSHLCNFGQILQGYTKQISRIRSFSELKIIGDEESPCFDPLRTEIAADTKDLKLSLYELHLNTDLHVTQFIMFVLCGQ